MTKAATTPFLRVFWKAKKKRFLHDDKLVFKGERNNNACPTGSSRTLLITH